MCGRIIVDYEEMMSVAGDTVLADWMTQVPPGGASTWNLAPTQQVPIVFSDSRMGVPRFETAYWSLVPPWAKELTSKFPTFNARAETAATKPSFKAAVRHARCAIPVSGFYEWTRPKSARVPHAIRAPGPVMTLAGLYSWWRDPGASHDDGWRLTATVLTAPSTGRMARVHDRMPVFLAPELILDWLDAGTVGDEHLLNAVVAAATPTAEALRIHAVKPLRGDGPGLLDPA